MRKMMLQLESLAVESFDTTAAGAPGGTVLAYDRTEGCTNTCAGSCFNTACTCPPGSCQLTCGGSCVLTCAVTCLGPTCPGSCVDTCGTCAGNQSCEESLCTSPCAC
jgi:hypothetical protein